MTNAYRAPWGQSRQCKANLGKEWKFIRHDDAGLTFMRHDEWNNAIHVINVEPNGNGDYTANSYPCGDLADNNPVVSGLKWRTDEPGDESIVLDLVDAGVHYMPRPRHRLTDEMLAKLEPRGFSFKASYVALSKLWKCAIENRDCKEDFSRL